jgi:hypothetical protein
VRFMDVNTGRLSGLKYKLVCCLKLTMDTVVGGIVEFVHATDGPAFLKRELVGFDVDRY